MMPDTASFASLQAEEVIAMRCPSCRLDPAIPSMAHVLPEMHVLLCAASGRAQSASLSAAASAVVDPETQGTHADIRLAAAVFPQVPTGHSKHESKEVAAGFSE